MGSAWQWSHFQASWGKSKADVWSRPSSKEVEKKWMHPTQSWAGQSHHMPPQCHSHPRPRGDLCGLPLPPQQGLSQSGFSSSCASIPTTAGSSLSESRPGKRKWPHLKIINMQG